MTRVDLDELEACVKGDQPFMWDQTLAAVAELRAAREVQQLLHTAPRDQTPLGVALARWDQFTRPAPEARP